MTTIREAAQALAAQDHDHAVELNGVGFNASDQWVHDVLRFPGWTDEQQRNVHGTLKKYEKQLSLYGIDYSSLAWEETIAVAGRGVVRYNNSRFIFEFKYDANLVDALKTTVQGRRWEPDYKYWWAPEFSYESVELFAAAQGFQLTKEAQYAIEQAYEHKLDGQPGQPSSQLLTKPQPKALPDKSVVVKDGQFVFSFPYDETLKENLKAQIPGRRWDMDRKYWTAPLTSEAEVRVFAAENGFVLGNSVKQLSEAKQVTLKQSKATDSDFMKDFRSKSGFKLRPYQRAGAEYIVKKKRSYLADEVRLGKTVTVMAALHHTQAYPTLIICPSSVVSVWTEHVKDWLPEVTKVQVAPASLTPDTQVYVTTYNRAQKNREALKAFPFKSVVVDEAHACKNRDSKRTQAIMGYRDRQKQFHPGIVTGKEYIWPLTATPVEKKPVEMLATLSGMDRLNDIGGFFVFAKRHCGWIEGVPGSINGAENLPELNEKLRQACWIRRLRSEVEDELPDKEYVHVNLPMSNPKRYADMVRGILDGEYTAMEAITKMTLLRGETAGQKLEAGVEWVGDFLESGKKLVLLGWHIEPLKQIHQAFQEQAVILTGSSSARDRVDAMTRFRDDASVRLFVGNIQAAGVGIDLSIADDIAVYEMPWNFSTLEQALGRIEKVGKKNKLGIYYLLAAGSIDGDIAEIVDEKRRVSVGVHNGREVSSEEVEMVSRLLQKVREVEAV